MYSVNEVKVCKILKSTLNFKAAKVPKIVLVVHSEGRVLWGARLVILDAVVGSCLNDW